MLTAGAEAGEHRGAKPLRELIERVTVARDAARPDGLDIVITRRLNAIGAFPNLRTKAVAGARYIRQKPAIDAVFAFRA